MKSDGPTPESREREDRLLSAAAAGDHAAFTQLYDLVSPSIYSLVVAMAPDHATARDCFQKTMLKVWQRAPSFDPARGHAFTWIVTIARRTVLDHLRQTGRDWQKNISFFHDPACNTRQSPPTDVTALQEEMGRVRAALASLPEEQSSALEMAFLQGMTHEAIAQTTGQPLGTIKARIRRALIKLRNDLQSGEAP
ncbi:MAG: sigma-70 family RNA polymerase sigma factor [Verrucomicrobiia bacterium]